MDCSLRRIDVASDPKDGNEEIRRLQGSINDLISLQALPAIWNGRESGHIVSTLLDVLVSMLRLNFAYARLSNSINGSPVEFIRLTQRRTPPPQPQEIGRVLDCWLTNRSANAPLAVPNPAGDGEVRIVPLRLGLMDEIGVLVAGSKRADFPTPTETLLLRVAANQALVALQEAQQLHEQKCAAEELERRVADRTAQLTTLNIEREQSEEALRQAQADLAHVSRVTTMGELTASIAHEVNQPLTAVVNNANACLELLAKGTTNVEEVREALAEIIDDADRASAVIMRVRQLARKAPCQKILLNLRDVITDVLSLARYESAIRRVAIRTELPKELPPVLGDRVQLQQVLLNLVVNGMDAMNTVEESQRVLIICARRETREGRPEATVRVQDTGAGIKPEQVDRLFETFYTTKPHGMGMGLAISRSIIEAHGGRLRAEPNQGPGAAFLFSLPAAPEQLGEGGPAAVGTPS
jgi:signal transduction histidine kinase